MTSLNKIARFIAAVSSTATVANVGVAAEEQQKFTTTVKCRHFKQTAGCDAGGKVEKTLPCSDSVGPGTSGFCECAIKKCEDTSFIHRKRKGGSLEKMKIKPES